MACCKCCEKTGACCVPEEGCSQKTFEQCEQAGGLFQGFDTVCGGEGECPCDDPQADPAQCEKCEGGEVVSYCPEDRPTCVEGCCVRECECVPCGDGFTAEFSITGSTIGPYNRAVPFGLEDFGNPDGEVGELFGSSLLECFDDVNFTFIRLQVSVSEILPFGTSNVFDIIVQWFCGADYTLDPGEWLVTLVGNLQTDRGEPVFNDNTLFVDYEKVYGPTDCTTEPVPFVDSDSMAPRVPCVFGDASEPDPCPFRVTARLRRV